MQSTSISNFLYIREYADEGPKWNGKFRSLNDLKTLAALSPLQGYIRDQAFEKIMYYYIGTYLFRFDETSHQDLLHNIELIKKTPDHLKNKLRVDYDIDVNSIGDIIHAETITISQPDHILREWHFHLNVYLRDKEHESMNLEKLTQDLGQLDLTTSASSSN
jgi:hypothetical protein